MYYRDVFVCHAYVDKARFVAPLVRALGRRAVNCWVDEGEVAPGDSLIASIENGLRTSQYVAVLITPAFLDRQWPEREMRAALSREIRSAVTVVVPILAVEQHIFFNAYPLLADKLYLDWGEGIDEVASRIAARFAREPAREWYHDHPKEFVGPVWIRVNAASIGEAHRLTARWGPYFREILIPALDADPVSLVHHKTRPDAQTIHVTVDPAAIVTFGQGAAPDRPELNIDEGWQRAAGWHFPRA